MRAGALEIIVAMQSVVISLAVAVVAHAVLTLGVFEVVRMGSLPGPPRRVAAPAGLGSEQGGTAFCSRRFWWEWRINFGHRGRR